jgi:hypothetical protein
MQSPAAEASLRGSTRPAAKSTRELNERLGTPKIGGVSGAPEVPDWLRQALASAQGASEILHRYMDAQAIANAAPVQIPAETIAKVAELQIPADAIANATGALEQYQAVGPSLERALKSIQTNWQIGQRVQELWRQYAPENWHELESGDLDVVDLVEESGIAVVWAPRAEIVDALIAADSRTRYEILVDASADVLDDLEAALAQARGAEVKGHAHACEFARETIAAARDGHWTAAQALAASGLGQVIHGMFGYPLFGGLGAARKKFSARDIDEATMTVLKVALLEVCTVKALTDIHRGAEPHLFNRHGTQHGDRRFFSQSNAVGGLLLLVGWIREFTWLSEHRPDFFTDAADAD